MQNNKGQQSSRHTLRVDEMDDGLILEDVDFLNPRDGIYTKSLQGVLQSLVICCGGLVHRFFLSVDKRKTELRTHIQEKPLKLDRLLD